MPAINSSDPSIRCALFEADTNHNAELDSAQELQAAIAQLDQLARQSPEAKKLLRQLLAALPHYDTDNRAALADASGQSVFQIPSQCFNLPRLEALARDPRSRPELEAAIKAAHAEAEHNSRANDRVVFDDLEGRAALADLSAAERTTQLGWTQRGQLEAFERRLAKAGVSLRRPR